MTSELINPQSGLAGGSRWTTVSLLNGAITGAALSAIQNWKAVSDPGGEAIPPPQRLPEPDTGTEEQVDTEYYDLFLPICPW